MTTPKKPRGKVEHLVAILFAHHQSQPAFEFYSGSPDPAGHLWHAFALDTPKEAAAVVFLRRYGRNPEFVFESRGLLLCGPVPEVTLEAVPGEVL